ncbi:MAG: RidA family protein [Candidatus Poribacteria bacterium]|nr:RidA family protein [Candidatus Poribacteria bacterium]
MTVTVFHNFSSAPTQVAPFSHAVEFDGWVQLTGQMPTDPIDDTKPLPDGIQAQTRRVMDNLAIILNEMQLGLENVLSTRVFLTNFKRDYEPMNNIYKSYFANNRLPARTCVGVTDLALGALVEIDMVARRF